MELSILRSPDLVVALDIGTTYSGYAWQTKEEFESNRNNINFNTKWEAGALQLHKTKTCIFIQLRDESSSELSSQAHEGFSLHPESVERVKIGHYAENMYMNLARRNDKLLDRCYLFSRFKLLLYSERFHKEELVEDQLSKQLPLFDVMTLFIKELKNHCLKKIETMGNEINEAKTLFVITVPAIWSDKAKKFMRDAAVQAGIKKRNVLLALEPEAAAISCIHLPIHQKVDRNFGEKGNKFLVADLGGGTADLSAIEVEKTGNLKQLCEPSGGLVGGQNINEAFLQVCHDSFKGENWRRIFAEATPVDMLRMEADFEQKKVTIGTNDDDDVMMNVDLPESVKNGLRNKLILLKEESCVKYEDSEFQFDPGFVRQNLFKTTCNKVFDTIKTVLNMEEAHGISTVILVGGFAESPVVINNIREMITNQYRGIKVVVPNSPFKSVLQGAVIYGHDPMIFSSRISRETYGVGTNRTFDETKHDVSKKWKNAETGEFYCKDIFGIHVKKGQSVRLLDMQPESIYNPLYKEQKSVGLQIFASERKNPVYTTDDGCRQIGEVTVDMPDTTGGTSRKVKVNMIYGGTELSVIAEDMTTGKVFNADINFGGNY